MKLTLLLLFTLLAVTLLPVEAKMKKRSGKGGKLDDPARNKKSRETVMKLAQQVRADPGRKHTDEDENGYSMEVVRKYVAGKRIRFQQYYKGIKVFGATVTDVDFEGQEMINANANAYGVFFENLEVDFPTANKGKLQSMTKRAQAKLRQQFNGYDISNEFAEPIVYVDPQSNEASLAVYVTMTAVQRYNTWGDLQSPAAIFDDDLEIITQWETIRSGVERRGEGPGGNPKIGFIEYQHRDGRKYDALTINVTGSGDMCYLESQYITTHHAHSSPYPITSGRGHQFACYRQAGDESNGAVSPLNDAHYWTHKTAASWFLHGNSYCLKTLPVHVSAHSGIYAGRNAGANQIMTEDGKTSYILFGYGQEDYWYPLTLPDIAAHEMAHLLLMDHSGLSYSNVTGSGCVNEAFADMTGVWLKTKIMNKKWGSPTDIDWTIGSGLGVYGSMPLRYLDDPTKDGPSIVHMSKWISYYTNVHYCSGIFNKVFYKLVTALTPLYGNEIYAMDEVYMLFYVTNGWGMWNRFSTMPSAAAGVLKTLDGLHRMTYKEENLERLDKIEDSLVVAAFQEVGIDCARSAEDNIWDCDCCENCCSQ